MNASAGTSSAQSAPPATSWVYAEDFVAESEAAAAAREAADRLGVTAVARGAASALTLLAHAVQARAVVEVGTGSGVSGLALFAGMRRDGILTSVDIETEHQQSARKAFVSVGIPTQRFRLISGAALTVLPKLSDGAYDVVFIDADKLEYAEYVDQALRLLRHGGVMAVAGALAAEHTVEGGVTAGETEAIRTAVDAIRENEDLVPALLPVGDGLLVAIKR